MRIFAAFVGGLGFSSRFCLAAAFGVAFEGFGNVGESEGLVERISGYCLIRNGVFELRLFLFLFEVSWVMPNNILELLHYWKTQGRRQSKEAI